MSISRKRKTRSLLERVQSIFNLINKEEEPFPKSKLKEVGLSPATAENWLKLIVFIQEQPKIRLVKTNKTTIVEKIENKFQLRSMKRFLDESHSLDIRYKSLEDYAKAKFIEERKSIELPDDEVCKNCGESRFSINPVTGVCQACINKYTESL